MPGSVPNHQPGSFVLTSRPDGLRDPGGAMESWEEVTSLVLVFWTYLGVGEGQNREGFWRGGIGRQLVKVF